ncbi:MAG: xanthine dehydrogenase family protein molybdopterin-binding subunit [Nitrososphaeria archaeon]
MRRRQGVSDRSERFFRGRGAFVADLELPGTIHLEFYRSRRAHARLLSVRGGLTHDDVPLSLVSVGESYRVGRGYAVEPALAAGKVLYYGQPVAAVYDRDRYRARDRLEEVDVRYEDLRPIVTVQDALSGPPIHEGRDDNVAGRFEVGSRFTSSAPVRVKERLYMKRIVPNPLETRGILVQYSSGRLNVWISTQSAYSIRKGLARALGLDEGDVNVFAADTGGAFGSKSAVYPEYVVAAYLSMKLKAPVKWVESREEHLQCTRPGRGAEAELEIQGDREGRIHGIQGKIYVDVGAYADDLSSTSPSWIAYQITGPYAIENVFIEGISVYTNKAPMGPYRGAGRPEAAFFMERMIDFYADEIGMDPLDVRMRNLPDGDFQSPTGLRVQGSRRFFEEGIRALGLDRRESRRGIGVSFSILIPAVHGGESARIKLEDGTAKVWLGGNPHWQRQELFVRRVLREVLGIPEDRVQLLNSDTTQLGTGVGTWGSRTAITAGSSLIRAAESIRRKAQELGIRSVDDLLSSGLSAEHYESMALDPSMISFLLTAARAEVVDGIKPVVREVWAYYDVGEALSDEAVRGQITGGLLMGSQEVIAEAITYDGEGRPEQETIAAAGVAYSIDAPEYHVHAVSYGRSRTPHGAKGVGESGTIGAPPAVARSLELIIGRRVRGTPIDLDLLA